MNSRVQGIAGAVIACVILLLATPVSAQYFGRNKVQYKSLDFQVLKTEHFDIYYYPTAREGIDIAARMAERWRARLGRTLGYELSGRQPLVLYASHPDFEQTNTIQGELGKAPAASPSRSAAASCCRSAARSPTPITSSATRSSTRFNST